MQKLTQNVHLHPRCRYILTKANWCFNPFVAAQVIASGSVNSLFDLFWVFVSQQTLFTFFVLSFGLWLNWKAYTIDLCRTWLDWHVTILKDLSPDQTHFRLLINLNFAYHIKSKWNTIDVEKVATVSKEGGILERVYAQNTCYVQLHIVWFWFIWIIGC